jgi:CheY-like chemotaxis protein
MAPVLAKSGSEALEKLEAASGGESEIQVILLDYMMPKMDGPEVARRVRDRYAEKAPKILLLSSAGCALRPEELAEVGIERVLTKPVKPFDLLDAIGRLFGAAPLDVAKTEDENGARHRDAPPMKLLLAEDGRVNQVVATRLLESLGHEVVLATDGREALGTLEKGEFDAVLMDVQMPEMDGYEAAERIREKEKETGRHVPIIAMTANAMAGDRERCLASGMDDYVAKPVRSGELRRVLGEVAATRGPDDGNGGEAGRAGEDAVGLDLSPKDVFDSEVFEKQNDDPGLSRQLLDIFEEECDALLARTDDAVRNGDAKALHEAAHGLKGMLGVYFSRCAVASAAEVDSLARAGDLEGAREKLPALREAAGKLGEALRKYREERGD